MSAKPKSTKASTKPAISGRYVSPLQVSPSNDAKWVVHDVRRSNAARTVQVTLQPKDKSKATSTGTGTGTGKGVGRGQRGVVAKRAPGASNPYAMTAEQTLEVLRRANVLTAGGRLTKVFK